MPFLHQNNLKKEDEEGIRNKEKQNIQMFVHQK